MTWYWVIQCLCGAWKARVGRRLAAHHRAPSNRPSLGDPPARVAVIIPAKGVSDFFDYFLELMLDQDHPDYRIIFVTESDTDPAWKAVHHHLNLPAGEHRWQRPASRPRGAKSLELVNAGLATASGQKVHNQLAAFRLLNDDDRIVAFVDADIVGHRDALAQLCAPLDSGIASVTTGYRWFVPASNSLPNSVGNSINASACALLGPKGCTPLWGGSAAMTRTVFEELDIPAIIDGHFCEDLPMTRAIFKAGKRIRFVRPLVMATPIDFSWSTLFEFGRRQYFILRIYWPRIWWTVLFFTTIYLAGFLLSWFRLISGEWIAALPLGLVFLFNSARTFTRTRYVAEQFGSADARKIHCSMRLEWFTTTLNYFVHWLIILSSSFIREIRWAGTLYRLPRGKPLEVIERTPPSDSIRDEG